METISRPISDRRFKMRVHQDEFLSEYGGRIPAGSVVPVDEDTAIRWIDNGIAVQAPDNAKTRKEERLEEIRAELLRLEAEAEQGGVYTAAITRDSFGNDVQEARAMPRRRRGPAVRAKLSDADVVNGDGFLPDEDES